MLIKKYYSVEPDVPANKDLPPKDRVWVELAPFTMPDSDRLQNFKEAAVSDFGADKAHEMYVNKLVEEVGKKIKGIHNAQYQNDAGEIIDLNTWELFYAYGPNEQVTWIIRSIGSHSILVRNERKNS